jgi:transcriptional regulator with GAF, ATPase, and Fis domain
VVNRESRVARLTRELREVLERQTATAGILQIIASSPSDVQPVFDAIATSAKRLIGGFSATVTRFVGDALHLVAFTPTNAKADKALQASFPMPLAELSPFELVRGGATVQFTDTESEDVPPHNMEMARLRGYRSMVFTPLMSNGTPIGMISVTRKEPGSFTAHYVQLLQTFADQAVIAIQNARLFNDTKEALERQTATAEILNVIASSPIDTQPVFDVIARSATELCEGMNSGVYLLQDGLVHVAGHHNVSPERGSLLVQIFV